MSPQHIVIGADHAGYDLKEALKKHLEQQGYTVTDVGCNSKDRADYPDFAYKAAEILNKGDCTTGVLCCGSGIGMAIGANRFPNVRAVVCRDSDDVKMSRLHNNANMICFGQRFTAEPYAIELLDTFLTSPFEGGRHQTRVDKLSIDPVIQTV